DLILVGSSVQSPALRAIVLHLPERRQDAWKRLKSQKAFRKDFELIARHVPELKAEAAEILATFVTDKARHKKPSPASRKTPEPVSGSKSRAKLLTKLLGR
ncbi:MAG TPA: hypothetical protein PLK06_00265, partial [bacterium]|nr:hypothetical protein [bacterium]